MATCPNCQCETPSGAVSCSRCGHPCDAADGAAPPTVRSVPLPPPMVEPIYTPAAPPPDSKPLPIQPALTRSLRGGGSSVVVVAEPVRTPPATVFGYSALPNGASPPALRDRPGPGTATAGPVPGVSGAAPTP